MRYFLPALLCALSMVVASVQAQQPLRRSEAMASPGGASLNLETGTGRVIGLGRAAASVFAADPKVAEVRPASATSLFVFGVGPGRTTVAAMDSSGAPIAQFDVTVHASSFAAQETVGALARQMPGSQIRGEGRLNGIMLNGNVETPLQAERVMGAARMNLGKDQRLDNQVGVRGGTQVNLHVRIAEMSRTLSRSLGVDWQAAGKFGRFALAATTQNLLSSLNIPASVATVSGSGFEAIIDALSQDQLVRMLAEPNLTALSGETASFIVGGEFPIPVSQQNNQVTVEFKQFGISLAFVPTVLDDGQINLNVRPEVSQLSTQGAVQLTAGNSTLQIPALSVRRAETTVVLGSGQSFVIAGLLEDSVTQQHNNVPILGDIPGIGALFGNDQYQHAETELVIIVTPYIVRPTSDPSALQAPTDGYKPPNDLERVVLLRQLGRTNGAGAPKPRIPGSAGFVLQ